MCPIEPTTEQLAEAMTAAMAYQPPQREHGRIVVDADGKPVPAPKLDADGKPIIEEKPKLDKDGKPIVEQAPQPTIQSLGPQELKPGDRAAGMADLVARGNLTPEGLSVFEKQDAVTQTEHDHFAREFSRLKADKAITKQYLDGDPDVAAHFTRLQIFLNLPIKKDA